MATKAGTTMASWWGRLRDLVKTYPDSRPIQSDFVTQPQLVFFVQGGAADEWMPPSSPAFVAQMLGALQAYYDANQGAYSKPVIHWRVRTDDGGSTTTTWHILVYRRPAAASLTGHYPEMVLLNERISSAHLVVPCLLQLPKSSGAKKDAALLTPDTLATITSEALMMRMGLFRKLPGANPAGQSAVPQYMRRVHADREKRAVRYILTNPTKRPYLLQGRGAEEWIPGTLAPTAVATLADATLDLYESQELAIDTMDQHAMTLTVPAPTAFAVASVRVFPNGTLYRGAPVMFMREERQGVYGVINRLLLYCHVETPRHTGSTSGQHIKDLITQINQLPGRSVEMMTAANIATFFEDVLFPYMNIPDW